jgi:putative transposase
MTNHIHLLLTPDDDSGCSLMMRDLARRYASYFNRRYAKTGQLWEGRYRSCLVDSAEYILACYRYIELNPVRARMVEIPAAHPWSSYAGNAGARVDTLLTPHVEYVALSEKPALRATAYKQLLSTADDPAFLRAMRESTEAGFPLVGERVKAELEAQGAKLGYARPGRRGEAISEGSDASQLPLLIE